MIKKDDPQFECIPDFPGYRTESKEGYVWSFKRRIPRRLKPHIKTTSKTGRVKSLKVNLYRNGKQHTKNLARLIMGVTDSKVQIDHIDRNIWHNWKSNLRIATDGQNKRNKTPQKSVSGYIGVTIRPNGNCTATMSVNNSTYYIGTYFDVYEAAAARNMAVSILYDDDFNVYNMVGGLILTLEDKVGKLLGLSWNAEKTAILVTDQRQNSYDIARSNTGFKGVYKNKYGRFDVNINVRGKQRAVHTYDCVFNAAAAWNVLASVFLDGLIVFNEVNGYILTL